MKTVGKIKTIPIKIGLQMAFFSGSCSVLQLHMKARQIKLIKITLIKSCILIVMINQLCEQDPINSETVFQWVL